MLTDFSKWRTSHPCAAQRFVVNTVCLYNSIVKDKHTDHTRIMNLLFTGNIAYGKTLFPHYKDNYQTMTDGVFYDDIDKSFMIYKSSLENITLTVDLEKTTSISSVIIHILSMSRK